MMNDSGSCIFCASDAASLRRWRQTAVLSLLCHPLVIVDHRLLSHRWTLIKFNSRSLIRVHLSCQCCVIHSWLSCCKFFNGFVHLLYQMFLMVVFLTENFVTRQPQLMTLPGAFLTEWVGGLPVSSLQTAQLEHQRKVF